MPTSSTLTVEPAAPASGDSLVFSGSGYEPGVGVTVVVHSPSAIAFFGNIADSDGNFSTAETETYIAYDSGDYVADSYQGEKHRQKPAASVSFNVS